MRRWTAAVGAAALLLAVSACTGGGGGITIPTNLPTSIPTSITLPTLPTRTETTHTETRTDTVTVTTTERPATRTVTETTTVKPPSPTTTAVPLEPTSGGLATWVWVVLALLLLLVIVLVIWLVRRTQTRAAWDNRLTAARQTASWVEESLVPQVVSRPTNAEAAATWRAAGPRLLHTDEELHDLAANAPDPERGRAAHDLRARLTALADAVGADTTTSVSASADDLRVRRAAIQRARTELRNYLSATAPHR